MRRAAGQSSVLARKTLGRTSLLVFAVGASSPLAVLTGVMPAIWTEGVDAVPLSFVVVGALFLVIAVGYVAMARHIPHPAPFYALLARGLGPSWGLAGAGVALLGYNAVQLCLYPLIGTRLADSLGGGPWWGWACLAWTFVAVLGRFRGADNARVLGGLLFLELAMIVLFDLVAFTHPVSTVTPGSALAPDGLVGPGVGGVIALATAALVGAETPPVFSEEARGSRTVSFSTFAAIGSLALLYAATAWAYRINVGQGDLLAAAQDPTAPFALVTRVIGVDVVPLMNVLVITSLLASMTAFHATVARYVFSMARDGLLPARLGTVTRGVKGGTPFAGSLVQSGVAGVTIACFAFAGSDPLATMFVWLSTISAVCILLLLTVASVGALAWFRRGGGSRESTMVRVLLPGVGGLTGSIVLVTMMANLGTLLGADPGSALPLLIVGVVAASAVLGLLWSWGVHLFNPAALRQAGRHIPDQILTRDPRLSQIKL